MANGSDLSSRLKLLFAEGYNLVINPHAKSRMERRQINQDEIVDIVKNAKNLKLVETQKAKYPSEEKYDCWFFHGKRMAYVVNLIIKPLQKEIEIITVVKNRIDKQKRFDKHVTHI